MYNLFFPLQHQRLFSIVTSALDYIGFLPAVEHIFPVSGAYRNFIHVFFFKYILFLNSPLYEFNSTHASLNGGSYMEIVLNVKGTLHNHFRRSRETAGKESLCITVSPLSFSKMWCGLVWCHFHGEK